MRIEEWAVVVQNSLADLWENFLSFLPDLVGAIIILIIGLIVASILEKIAERIIYYLRLDAALRSMGVDAYFSRANMNLNVGHFIGKFVYWFVVIAFILAASDTLGFFALSSFLSDVLFYIPNVIIAILIMLAALVAANFLRRLVVASVKGANLNHAHALGTLTWWIVTIFGFLAALHQLGIAETIVTAIVTGFVAMLALAGGLAFGLGGRDKAQGFLDGLNKEMKK
ncbi:MAG: hypothetical protein Q8P45_02630 [Candidatus Harrisonbacteria bacterium]|nr:hypothetical protein [Candidatus Harrisonbacteria bacterium]